MSGRVIVGDAVWTSKKIARLDPPSIRAEYCWLYSLAGANGVFEIDARAIWARAYAFGRPDKSVDDVEQILRAFETVGLLFTWEQDGKRWGYWTGSDRPGRLPRKSWRKRDAKKGKLGPEPPSDALKTYENQVATHTLHASSTPPAREQNTSSVSGFGSGLGFGSELKHICADKNRLHDAVLSLPAPTLSPEDEALNRIWNYYLATFKKNPKILSFSETRKQKGRARLKECLQKTGGDLPKAEELMKAAVDALASSTFHTGTNDRHKKYTSWEKHLFKSREQMEEWLEQTTEVAAS